MAEGVKKLCCCFSLYVVVVLVLRLRFCGAADGGCCAAGTEVGWEGRTFRIVESWAGVIMDASTRNSSSFVVGRVS